jgi:hypothetical protein
MVEGPAAEGKVYPPQISLACFPLLSPSRCCGRWCGYEYSVEYGTRNAKQD